MVARSVGGKIILNTGILILKNLTSWAPRPKLAQHQHRGRRLFPVQPFYITFLEKPKKIPSLREIHYGLSCPPIASDPLCLCGYT